MSWASSCGGSASMSALRSSNSGARPDRFRTVEGEGPESAPLRRSGASDVARGSASLMLPGHQRGACHRRALRRAAAQALKESGRASDFRFPRAASQTARTDAKRSGPAANFRARHRATAMARREAEIPPEPADAHLRVCGELLEGEVLVGHCAGCSEEQSRMTPLRRELPP